MDDRPTDPIAEVSRHIEKARDRLEAVEHPYGGDHVVPLSDGNDAEARTQGEIREQAAIAPDDATTSREELELDLMEAGDSEAGEGIETAGDAATRAPR
jgi:hypothetical protein